MKSWIPLVLEQNPDAVYSECRCPKCGFDSVYHMGVPCQKHSCPKCGELMNRLEEPEDVKESVVKLRVHIPTFENNPDPFKNEALLKVYQDASKWIRKGHTVVLIADDKTTNVLKTRISEMKIKEGIVTKTKSGVFKLPDGSGFFTATIGTKKKKKHLKESELIEAYLTYVQDSELQEVNWQSVKNYLTKERPQPPWVQKRIAAAKVGDTAFAQRVAGKAKQQKLAQIKAASTQKPVLGTPVRVGT